MTTKCPDDQCDDDCCPDGLCQMIICDDSYDDHFGTVHIPPYLLCMVCNRTEALS